MLRQSVLFLWLCVGLATSAKFSYKLEKVKSIKRNLIEQGNWPEYVAYRRAAANYSIKANRQPIYDYLEAEYCVVATVGTPGTQFTALLDTSSDISWVPSVKCGTKRTDCPSYCKGNYCAVLCDDDCCSGNDDIACKTKKRFDPSKSTTYTTSYGDFRHYTTIGKVEGVYANDVWSIGTHNESSLTLSKFRFGLVSSLGDNFKNFALDGIVGLARSHNPKSLIVQAIEENLFDEPFVSLYLKDEGHNQNGKVAGAITFGGIDNENCGLALDFLPLTSNTEWEFKINSVTLNGQQVRGGIALSDTGTAYIHGPYPHMNVFTRAIGATYDYRNDQYIVPCNAQFTFSVNIGRHNYKIDRQHLINQLSTNKCELMVKSTDHWDEYDWILGVPFASTYCHIYDYTGKIGFALTSQ